MRIFIVIVFLNLFSSVILAQRYESQEIVAATFQQTINKTGKLDFKRTLDLSFKATGYLKVLTVDEGEYFAKGDILAALETTELSAAKNATYATLLNAKRNVHRVSELLAKKLSSAQALDSAKTEVETARAAYRSAFYNLEKAQIIAPFSGQVIKRFTDIGQLQSPAQTALTVTSLANNWIIKVALTEAEVALVSLDQAVNIRLNNAGDLKGVISKIPASADAVTQLFDIEILLPKVEKAQRLIAGQLAHVTIEIETDTLVFEVPIDALMKIDEQGYGVLMVLQADGQPAPQAFPIYQLNNQHIYLNTDNTSNAITVVTHGWHNIN